MFMSERIAQCDSKLAGTIRGRGKTHRHRHVITIEILPDDVFLRVFDFCRQVEYTFDWWHRLVHVSRRWRQLIFASPRRLNLELAYNCSKRAKKALGVWPAFPLTVCGFISHDSVQQENLLVALEHHRNRVRIVVLKMLGSQSQLDEVARAMQQPFPALTDLGLDMTPGQIVLILPDRFLGESAPCLREIHLRGISFPALPTLLLSTSDLTDLHLTDISLTSITPVAMATGLAATTRLKALTIEFRLVTSLPHQSPVTLPTRAILPALSQFRYRGDSEYLEDLVALINCPRLKSIDVLYSNYIVDAHVSQLFQFIGLVEDFKLTRFRRARIQFYNDIVHICIEAMQADSHPSHLTLQFPHQWPNFPVRTTRQHLIRSCLPLSTVRHLTVARVGGGFLEVRDYVDWLALICLFPAVEALHVSGGLAILIDPMLDDLTREKVGEVLPALRFLNVDGWTTTSVREFIAARQLSGHPVTIVKTQEEFEFLEAHYGEATSSSSSI